jgi:hypothetical protein
MWAGSAPRYRGSVGPTEKPRAAGTTVNGHLSHARRERSPLTPAGLIQLAARALNGKKCAVAVGAGPKHAHRGRARVRRRRCARASRTRADARAVFAFRSVRAARGHRLASHTVALRAAAAATRAGPARIAVRYEVRVARFASVVRPLGVARFDGVRRVNGRRRMRISGGTSALPAIVAGVSKRELAGLVARLGRARFEPARRERTIRLGGIAGSVVVQTRELSARTRTNDRQDEGGERRKPQVHRFHAECPRNSVLDVATRITVTRA